MPRNVETRRQFSQVHLGANNQRFIGTGVECVFGQVALIADIANDLFQHVLEGRNAHYIAVFVDHDRKMALALLKGAHQLGQKHGGRHDQRLLVDRLPIYFFSVVFEQPEQQILGQHDARYIVDVTGGREG